MGDLIVLKRPTEASRSERPAGASADILFFTGVRYVRIVDDIVPAPTTTRRRRNDKARKTVEAQAAALTL